MKIRDLKNYGVGLSKQLSTLPKKDKQEIYKIGSWIIFRRLGFLKTFLFLMFYCLEKSRMSKIDLSIVREKGLNDEQFIKEQIRQAAVFSAIKKTAGIDTTNEIVQLMSRHIGARTLNNVMPQPEDFLRFDRPFDAFKEYLISVAAGDNKEGCHVVKIVENSDDAFQMDIEFCAWYEIYNKLGIKEACFVSCNSDEILLPEYLKPIKIIFKRTNTISQGATHCDFRFIKKCNV